MMNNESVLECLSISDYQDYDTSDISRLFYNILGLDDECIIELSDEKLDLQLEAKMEEDIFGIIVKSKVDNGVTYVSILSYYEIKDTIHKYNVKKMFNNWGQEICDEYKCALLYLFGTNRMRKNALMQGARSDSSLRRCCVSSRLLRTTTPPKKGGPPPC